MFLKKIFQVLSLIANSCFGKITKRLCGIIEFEGLQRSDQYPTDIFILFNPKIFLTLGRYTAIIREMLNLVSMIMQEAQIKL